MILKEIREIAKGNGIRVGNMKKDNIIRAIQRAEGNFDWFWHRKSRVLRSGGLPLA